jgi:hypothetical protein
LPEKVDIWVLHKERRKNKIPYHPPPNFISTNVDQFANFHGSNFVGDPKSPEKTPQALNKAKTSQC